jgi:hypothetical protein
VRDLKLLIIPVAAVLLSSFVMRKPTNWTNPDSELDRADTVTMSISAGQLCWREQCWEAHGNQHTPRGRFRIESSMSGKAFGADDLAVVLPFYTVPFESIPQDNPQYDPQDNRGMTWAIHEDNRSPGQIGSGCLLVSREDTIDIASKVQGATIIIGD